MPRRDPQTGKFVSGNRPSGYDRRETLSGSIVVNIPAADNAGGSTIQQWTGSNGIVIDFDNELHSDEVFHLQSMEYSGSLALPTTATAESSAVVGYVIGSDMVNPQPFLTRTTSLSSLSAVDNEEGVADIAVGQSDDDSILLAGALYAEASIADSVNGLAGGADYENESRTFRPWRDLGTTVAFDQDDELAVTGELSSRNVSDHQVVYQAVITVHGWVEELD